MVLVSILDVLKDVSARDVAINRDMITRCFLILSITKIDVSFVFNFDFDHIYESTSYLLTEM
jgi:hypothetical protein